MRQVLAAGALVRPTTAGCESYNTCARCTNVPACAWSVQNQTCGGGTGRPAASCPTFAVDNTGPDGSAITVTVSNDSAGLVDVLAGSSVKCVLNMKRYDASVDGHRIVCRTPAGDRRTTKFLWVVFDEKRLQFDDIHDHYVTEYPAGAPDECRRDESPCVSCAWDDEQSVRFYCTWCPSRDDSPCAPYHYCDARAPPEYKRLKPDEIRRAVKATVVGDQCAAARIVGFRPDRGLRAGRTNVRIDVRKTLLDPRSFIDVTVAGRQCVDVTVGKKTGTLTCTVTAAAAAAAEPSAVAGPVEVTYYTNDAGGSSLNLTLRSARNFTFVNPAIATVQPDGGPVTGGTALTVHGSFGIVGADDGDGIADIRVYVAGDAVCEISLPVRPDRLRCVTTDSDPRSGPVKVVFDGRQTVLGPRFEYVPLPALDDGQSWSGIASGGTELWARGRGLSRVPNVTLYVTDGHRGRRYGRCRAANDTHMTCRPPALDVGPSVRALPCGFVAHFAATEPVPFAEYTAGYRLHPDPVFADFEADGCCDLTVNDANPDRGYGAGDVTVRLPSAVNDTDGECTMTVPGQRIVCRLRRWPSPDPQTVVVAVGDSPARNVTRKKTQFFNNPFTAIVWPSVTIVVYVLFIAFLCVALSLLRAPKTYDLSVSGHRSRRQQSATALRPLRRQWRRRGGGGSGSSGGGSGDNSGSARPISLERYG